jgi:hypothetical protein
VAGGAEPESVAAAIVDAVVSLFEDLIGIAIKLT